MNRKTKFAAAITLVTIAPCGTELLSSNAPASVFFQPATLFPLLLIYGLPALLVRELWVRWNLSFWGLFCLGLGYGIYNEGVLAQTLRLSEHVPLEAFDGYQFLGVNWPWAALILPWHAFHAIIFPIAITHWLFPSQSRVRWFSPAWFGVGLVFLVLFGTLFSLTNKKVPFSPPMLLFFYAAMGVLACLAKKSGAGNEFLQAKPPARPMAAVAGFIFYPVLVLSLAMVSKAKLPAIVIVAASGLILYGMNRLLRRFEWFHAPSFLLFVLGDYLAVAMFTVLAMSHGGSPFNLIVGCVLAGVFACGIFRIIRAGL